MTSDLADDLQTVDGVGEATSEKLIQVLEDGGYLGESKTDAYLSKARDAALAGDYRMAGIYLKRASE